MESSPLSAEYAYSFEILKELPMTDRLLVNMTRTAIRGFKKPATAKGIPSPL